MSEVAVEDELRHLEHERCRAVSAADLRALDILLHRDLRHVHVTGTVQDKATYLSQLPGRPRVTERESLAVRVVGDVAVTSGIQRNTRPGRPTDRLHVLQVWLREHDVWQLLEFASSGPLSDARAANQGSGLGQPNAVRL